MDKDQAIILKGVIPPIKEILMEATMNLILGEINRVNSQLVLNDFKD